MGNVSDAADFRGTSRSVTTLHGTASWPECRDCGSSLHGRLETVRRRESAITYLYRCRCKRGRRITREAAA